MRFYLLILFSFSIPAFASTNNSADDITNLHVMQADWTDTLLKDKKSLLRYAEPILFKTYGKDQILAEKPYVIIFKKGIWTMDGTLPEGYLGGTFHIVIKA